MASKARLFAAVLAVSLSMVAVLALGHVDAPSGSAQADSLSAKDSASAKAWTPPTGKAREKSLDAGIKRVERAFNSSSTVRVAVTRVVDGKPETTATKLRKSKAKSTLKDLADDSTVVMVQPDVKARAIDTVTPAEPEVPDGGETPAGEQLSDDDDDNPINQLWNLVKLKAEQAWDQVTGSGVTVAVVDTGVDASHPEFGDRVLEGYDYAAECIGDDPCFPDLPEPRDARYDPHGHGTHVAGLIAAANDGVGSTGLAYDAQILPMRVLDENGWGYLSDTARAIKDSTDRGAQIVNLSLGGGQFDMSYEVAYAHSHGVAVVAAAGNEALNGNPEVYPAATPGVFAVGSTTLTDNISATSSHHDYVSISAPGHVVYSTYRSHGYGFMTGTSMATPHVSAALALLLEKDRQSNPGASALGLESTLTATALDLGAPGKDVYFGYGRIQPLEALNTIGGSEPEPEPEPEPSPTEPEPTEPTDPGPTEPEPTEPTEPEPTEPSDPGSTEPTPTPTPTPSPSTQAPTKAPAAKKSNQSLAKTKNRMKRKRSLRLVTKTRQGLAVRWVSLTPKICTVNSKGLVKSKKRKGTCKVRATSVASVKYNALKPTVRKIRVR